jgi:hypothetical protein
MFVVVVHHEIQAALVHAGAVRPDPDRRFCIRNLLDTHDNVQLLPLIIAVY